MAADDLARRLVAAPGFRWLPGMRLLPSSREPGQPFDGRLPVARRMSDSAVAMNVPAALVEIGFTLDLSDPATEGCLLRLAREAWAAAGWEGLELHTVGEGVAVVFVQHIERSGWQSFRAPSPSEALAHAILAAGEVRDA